MKRTIRFTKRVCAFGTFDVLHLGHLRYLEEAKKLGGPHAELVVVVARDISVKKFKGISPVFPEEHRLALIASLKPVDIAVLGNEDPNTFDIIEDLRPKILAIGHDQWVDLAKLREKLVAMSLNTIQIIKLPKFKDDLGSSSLIKKRIATLFNQGYE